MIQTLYGTKKGMTSRYDARGRRVGATILEVQPNFVTDVRTIEKDGYVAVQLGSGWSKKVSKPVAGLLKKSKVETQVRYMREVKVSETDVEPGQQISLPQVFKKGDAVKVSGVTKGKGFQGGVRRWGFHGGPKTHGQSDRHRSPGSSGSGTTPGRVFKGKHMAGHMGMDQASYINVEVLEVEKDKNLIYLKGGVPGPIGGLIRIENIGKIKGYIAPPEEKPEEEEEEVKVEGAQEVENTENVSSEENAAKSEVAEEAVEEAKEEENANS